ncbi:MAG: DAK2 domain-containing protein [Phascolarctobacterium sp.]|nr:DAK2 domain-containing protein [Phascolarctobacterium sp.]
MMISMDEFKARLKNACDAIIAAKDELTDIDSHFGDADHGITMEKVAKAITSSMEEDAATFNEMFSNISMEVMMINGGSSSQLWAAWMSGFEDNCPAKDSLTVEELKELFASAYEDLASISKAKVGDKTMMDALIPAVEAIKAYEGDMEGLFKAAAEAATKGAEASKNFVSKFGRARSYGEQTLGTPDAGAVSMKYFFEGLAK